MSRFENLIKKAFKDMSIEDWKDDHDMSDGTMFTEGFEHWKENNQYRYVDPGEEPTPKQLEEMEDAYCYEMRDEQIGEFWRGFNSEANMDSNGLVIYRAITVDDPEEFLFMAANGEQVSTEYKGIGIYWSWSHDGAEAHWGGSYGEEIILHGFVGFNDIDYARTALANSHLSLGSEKEITLKPGAKVKITLVEMQGEEIEVNNDKGFFEVAANAEKYPALSSVLHPMTLKKVLGWNK